MSPVYVPQTGAQNTFQIGRLLTGPPAQWYEPVGDPTGTLGGAVVPAQRTAPQAQATIATWAADGHTDTQAARYTLRRQLRSLLNNTPLKHEGFLYIQYADDPEQNGWYVPDQGSLQDLSGSSGLATGLWQVSQQNWSLLGHPRTHREGRLIWMKDLRTGLYQRDTLGWIYSTDFSSLPNLQLTVLPSGASQAALAVTGQITPLTSLPAGRDGGVCELTVGRSDLDFVAYERPEASLNLGDVIVYDRMGTLDAPSAGPDAAWSELYGEDWQWSWVAGLVSADAPVLDNGQVRVRYDDTSKPGLRVDVWNGTAYVEQGKLTVYRLGDVSGYCDTWVSSSLIEWTPERAVMQLVLANSADSYSREIVRVIVQRGRLSATFECYPAVKADGATQADARLVWTMNGPDNNDMLMFEPSTAQPPAAATDQIWSTTNSGWTSAAGTFSSSTSNLLSVLRCQGGAATVGPYQVNLAVVQQSTTFAGISDSSAYGSSENAVEVSGAGGMGYLQLQVGFVATQADQVQSGTLTSWTSSQSSQYRVFQYSGATPVWSDVGEFTGTALTLASASWAVAFQSQDRSRVGAIYGGCRDFAQAALSDSQVRGAIVAR